MRLFYQAFPIRDALRHELGWTHYRRLLWVDNEHARRWYMTAKRNCAQNWSESKRPTAPDRSETVLTPHGLSTRRPRAIVGSSPQRSACDELAGHATGPHSSRVATGQRRLR
ncbi:hypothetical protein EMIT0P12_40162 [Pseudomonas sp. IT-P12]